MRYRDQIQLPLFFYLNRSIAQGLGLRNRKNSENRGIFEKYLPTRGNLYHLIATLPLTMKLVKRYADGDFLLHPRIKSPALHLPHPELDSPLSSLRGVVMAGFGWLQQSLPTKP